MTTLPALYAALLAALTTAGLTVYDGEPAATPTGPYVLPTDSSGLPLRTDLTGRPSKGMWSCQVMCVAHTRGGVRDLVGKVRTALLGLPLDGNHPLIEVASSPMLSGGPPEDVRQSMTLVYQLTTRL